MTDHSDIVKRLRNFGAANTNNAKAGVGSTFFDAAVVIEDLASKVELLAAEVKWLRLLDSEHKDNCPCPDLALRGMYRSKARDSRRATDAAFKELP